MILHYSKRASRKTLTTKAMLQVYLGFASCYFIFR